MADLADATAAVWEHVWEYVCSNCGRCVRRPEPLARITACGECVKNFGKANAKNYTLVEKAKLPTPATAEQKVGKTGPEANLELDRILTRELRARLVAATGFDLHHEDPAIALVVMAKLVLEDTMSRSTEKLLDRLKLDLTLHAAKLEELKTHALRTASSDLTLLVSSASQQFKLELDNAQLRLDSLAASIESPIRMTRGYWMTIGAMIVAAFIIGFIVRGEIHFG